MTSYTLPEFPEPEHFGSAIRLSSSIRFESLYVDSFVMFIAHRVYTMLVEVRTRREAFPAKQQRYFTNGNTYILVYLSNRAAGNR